MAKAVITICCRDVDCFIVLQSQLTLYTTPVESEQAISIRYVISFISFQNHHHSSCSDLQMLHRRNSALLGGPCDCAPNGCRAIDLVDT